MFLVGLNVCLECGRKLSPPPALLFLFGVLEQFGLVTEQSPRSIGVTSRIRTGTNAFTGRDAAVTS